MLTRRSRSVHLAVGALFNLSFLTLVGLMNWSGLPSRGHVFGNSIWAFLAQMSFGMSMMGWGMLGFDWLERRKAG